jgi:hypothetical protein
LGDVNGGEDTVVAESGVKGVVEMAVESFDRGRYYAMALEIKAGNPCRRRGGDWRFVRKRT